MRIINSVLGDASGGRWEVVCRYSQLLQAAGHRVAMLLDRRYHHDLGRIPAAVEVVMVRNRGHYDYLAAWQARARLRAFAPDLAIAHCSRSVAVLRRALARRVPVLAVSHSNKVRRLLPADAWIALSRHIAEKIGADPGTAGKPCFVIPNMIDLERSRSLPDRPLNRPPRIGALGRFDPVKGFDIFLDALAELRRRGCDFEAVLAGAGAGAAALQEQLQRLGLTDRVALRGWVSDVPGFLATLDLLCVPARADAFGLTPLEAAAAGVPLVLSRVSGHREMFSENREALFSEVEDPVSTADRMQQLLQQPALAETLRRSAYLCVHDRYSAPSVSKRILEAIDTVVDMSKQH